MNELSIRLQHRQQHAAVQHSDVSPNPPQSPVFLGAQPSYANESPAPKDDSSDDDDGYVKPNAGVARKNTQRDDEDDDDDDDDDDDEDEEEEDVSDRNTLGDGHRQRNKECHDYINVLTCHH